MFVFAVIFIIIFFLQISESDHKLWWEDFMTEFFHENATLAIEVDLGEGMRKFCESGIAGVGRTVGQKELAS